MRLGDWLKQNKCSQQKCADKVGVSQGRISQIVKGDPRVPLELAAKISAFTDGEVEIADLLPERAS